MPCRKGLGSALAPCRLPRSFRVSGKENVPGISAALTEDSRWKAEQRRRLERPGAPRRPAAQARVHAAPGPAGSTRGAGGGGADGGGAHARGRARGPAGVLTGLAGRTAWRGAGRRSRGRRSRKRRRGRETRIAGEDREAHGQPPRSRPWARGPRAGGRRPPHLVAPSPARRGLRPAPTEAPLPTTPPPLTEARGELPAAGGGRGGGGQGARQQQQQQQRERRPHPRSPSGA